MVFVKKNSLLLVSFDLIHLGFFLIGLIGFFTFSGIMVGLGENKDEILQVMDDLKAADVDFLTIGQYLQPSVKHFPLDRYYTPQEFNELGNIAKSKGFLLVSSSPLTRSSYHADEDFAKLQQNRINIH